MSSNEIGTDRNTKLISISIPVFPPFKLRSSLIDKDPVIWEYLLSDYITLFRKLIAFIPYYKSKKNQKSELLPYVLSSKTINQLHEFILSFLHESSLESTQVFSLGAINPNIRQNQHILKLAVFKYIKEINFANLKIMGVSIWEFCKVYVSMADKYSAQGINQALVTIPTIRKLIEGTIKSTYTSRSDDLSVTGSLQDYLGKLIAAGKWRQEDYEVLYSLLGQRTKKRLTKDNLQNKKNVRNVKVQKGDINASDFSQKFVDLHWIQILEEIYAGGTGVNSKTATKIMVISLCSLSSMNIVRLLKDKLEVDNLVKFKHISPLVASVVLSKKYNDLNPDLREMLTQLLVQATKKGKLEAQFDATNIQSVIDMFPQLSPGQVKTLLFQNNQTVESVINKMLETNLDDLVTIENYDERLEAHKAKKKKKKASTNTFEFNDKDNVYQVQIGKTVDDHNIDDIDTEYKKKLLERSLALLYRADEDEPDDTYLENETVSGNLRAVDDGEQLTPSADSKAKDTILQIEHHIFGIYQSSPDFFQRSNRKSSERDILKKETGWTDEQIEGWARMLQKNPKRYKILEENYLLTDSSLNSFGKKSNKWTAKKKNVDDEDDDERHVTDKSRGRWIPQPTASHATKKNDNFQKYIEKKKQAKAKAAAKKHS